VAKSSKTKGGETKAKRRNVMYLCRILRGNSGDAGTTGDAWTPCYAREGVSGKKWVGSTPWPDGNVSAIPIFYTLAPVTGGALRASPGVIPKNS
jgi:hypothetical protein